MSQTKVQLVNDVSGNSGFGLSSAESVLHVSKAVSAGSDNFLLRIQNPTNASDARVGMFFHVNAVTGSGSDGAYIESANSGSDNGDIRFGSITNLTKSERLRIDSSGRLLVGTTTLGEGSADNLTIQDSSDCGITIRSGSTSAGNLFFTDGTSDQFQGYVQYVHNTNHLGFGTQKIERMRILSNGGLMINDNGSTRIGEPKLHVLNGGASNNVASFFFNTSDDRDALLIRHNGASGGTSRGMINFLNSAGNGVGHIHATGSTVTYNSVSDYRLKENVVAISNGITRLKTLKPSRFNFIADAETTVDGFLAHEVTAVPEAITGEKDAVDSDNNPVYQAIDQSKLVPLLTAALQEAIAKIEVLETKVAALEAK